MKKINRKKNKLGSIKPEDIKVPKKKYDVINKVREDKKKEVVKLALNDKDLKKDILKDINIPFLNKHRKRKYTYRITDEYYLLLEKLAFKLNMNKNQVLDMALTDLAVKLDVQIDGIKNNDK